MLASFTDQVSLVGSGHAQVCIAVLDGLVDLEHAAFRGARISQLETLVPTTSAGGAASAHGTHVASIIFGQAGGPVRGLAPTCRGVSIPIFSDGGGTGNFNCSQLDLARALLLAIEHGAHIINISGGQLTPSGDPDPILAHAIKTCADKNILIVAAAGNDGCECLHVPAAAPSVLAVGAMDDNGVPLAASNWGARYLSQGVLAPGADVLGAGPNGAAARKTGTSFAAPLVSGFAGVLAGIQIASGNGFDARSIRAAILESALPCLATEPDDCARSLAGRLNIAGTVELITRGKVVNDINTIAPSEDRSTVSEQAACPVNLAPPTSTAGERMIVPSEAAPASKIGPSECGCGGGKSCSCSGGSCSSKKPTLVFAIGKIGYDFGSEARRDSFFAAAGASAKGFLTSAEFLDYLGDHPYEASSLIWTLNLDATPIYAILPSGPFAAAAYEEILQFWDEQVNSGAELVSIAGVSGGSVKLQSGQVIPLLVPTIRGMNNWSTSKLVVAVLGPRPPEKDKAARESYDRKASGFTDFLNRIYYDLRNLGITAEDRALNYSAVNAAQAKEVIEAATQLELDLDTISVKKSPICRPDSDCYDVELSFFNPVNTNAANRIYRYTVDVSDIVPVGVGQLRQWTRRPAVICA